MFRYALLVAAWLLLLSLILHSWLARDEDAPVAIIALLAAISLIPLAARIRIGNWFDFTKKVDNLETELNAAKQNISQLSAQLTTLSADVHSAMLTTQAQQQIVANLPDPETAKAFAQSLTPPAEKLYPPPGARDARRKSGNVTYFLWAADEIIASAKPSLQAYYLFAINMLEGTSILGSPQVHQPTESMIHEMRRICTEDKRPIPILRDEALPHLDALERLISLRQSVATGDEDAPSIQEGRIILSEAAKAAGFFGGAVAANADIFAIVLRSVAGNAVARALIVRSIEHPEPPAPPSA